MFQVRSMDWSYTLAIRGPVPVRHDPGGVLAPDVQLGGLVRQGVVFQALDLASAVLQQKRKLRQLFHGIDETDGGWYLFVEHLMTELAGVGGLSLHPVREKKTQSKIVKSPSGAETHIR